MAEPTKEEINAYLDSLPKWPGGERVFLKAKRKPPTASEDDTKPVGAPMGTSA
jgi:hypothetical protein